MVDVKITVGKARGLATFDFVTAAGRPPRLSSIVVTDRESGRHCWLIQPGVLAGAVDTQAALGEELHRAGLSVADGVDPRDSRLRLYGRDERRSSLLRHEGRKIRSASKCGADPGVLRSASTRGPGRSSENAG